MYAQQFASFMMRYALQLTVVLSIFYCIYKACLFFVVRMPMGVFFSQGLGVWLWIGPLCLAVFGVLRYTQSLFGIQLYFLEK